MIEICRTVWPAFIYGRLKPISEKFIPEALAVSGHSREETLTFEDPEIVMGNFTNWITETCKDRPIFISDNNGFDWMFICWYFHHFIGTNPFGFSSQNLGSLYKGIEKKRHVQNLQTFTQDKNIHTIRLTMQRECRSFIDNEKQKHGLKIKL